jgi:hypothetical protein
LGLPATRWQTPQVLAQRSGTVPDSKFGLEGKSNRGTVTTDREWIAFRSNPSMTTTTAQNRSIRLLRRDRAERDAPAVTRGFNRQEATACTGITRTALDRHLRPGISRLRIGGRLALGRVDLAQDSRNSRPNGMLGPKPLAGARAD